MATTQTVTIYLNTGTGNVTNTNSTTVTLNTNASPEIKLFIQSIVKNGGVFDDAGNYYPSTAILKITSP